MNFSKGIIVAGLASALQIGAALAQTGAAQKSLSDCQNGDKNADLAIKGCTALLKNDNGIPAFGDVYYNRGFAYETKKQYDLALADFSQAIKRKPDFVAAYENRGYVFSIKHQYNEAIRDFDQALKLNPRSRFALDNRGRAKIELGDKAGGEADIAHAKSLSLIR